MSDAEQDSQTATGRWLARASLILGWATCFLWLLGCLPLLLMLASLRMAHTPSAIVVQSLLIVAPFAMLGGLAVTLGVIARRRITDETYDQSRRRALRGMIAGGIGAIAAIPAFFMLNAMQLAGLKLWSVKRLKQLSVAAHDLHISQEHIPLAIYDRNKKPLLSWRVAILPYIEKDRLYKEFHLDEPWDSPHNLALLPRMPGLYASGGWPAGDIARSGLTRFKVFVGHEAPFAHDRRITLGILARCDGSSNTMFIVEAGDPVPWTKPEDFAYHPNQPLPNLDGPHEHGFYFADFSGAVHLVRKGAPEEVIRSLITYDGKEDIPLSPWVE